MYLEIGDKPIFNNEKKGAGLVVNADKQFCYYLNSGRNALYQVIKLENIHKVYVCSYNCYTVIEPFVKNNIIVELYDVDRCFNIVNLFEKIDNETEKCAVVLQNYYATYFLDEVKQKLKEYSNVLVIEDITQSMLDNRVFTGADYYVGSIRKWAGTGEGGLLLTDKKIECLASSDDEIINLQTNIAPMQLEYINNRNQQLKLEYRAISAKIELLFDEKNIQKISDFSMKIVSDTDFQYIKTKRRENFAYLLERLKDFEFIELPIKELNNNSVPLYLPIYVKNRDKLQQFLFKSNIYMPILWPIYDKIYDIINEETRYIYDHILCLHIDQRYDKTDMDRIYYALKDY